MLQQTTQPPDPMSGLLRRTRFACCNDGADPLYQYDKLADDEIRTLIIHPGQPKDRLRVTLERHHLCDSSKPYAALSYVWGSLSRKRALHVGDAVIRVTRSAEALLRRIRDGQEERRVWIDAICINQADVAERSHQVSLMNAIFSGASRVVVWVGESDRHTGDLFAFFRRCEEHQDAFLAAADADHRSTSEADSLLELDAYERQNRGIVTQVLTFTNRTWFQRAWTFQEACLSARAELRCGTHAVPWRAFIAAASCLNARGMTAALGPAADTVMALAHFSASSPRRQTPVLSVLLPLTRNLQSSDPRDKIFSLLGMAERDGLRGFVAPDYRLDTAQVYTRCARAMIVQERGLSVLCGALGPLQDAALPSWVPDWRCPRRTAYIHGFEWPVIQPFFHEINKGAPFANDVGGGGGGGGPEDGGRLALRGARIDVVDAVCQAGKLLKHIEAYGAAGGRKGARWVRKFDARLEDVCKRLGLPPPPRPNDSSSGPRCFDDSSDDGGSGGQEEGEEGGQQEEDGGRARARDVFPALCAGRDLERAGARGDDSASKTPFRFPRRRPSDYFIGGGVSRRGPPRMRHFGTLGELDGKVALMWTFLRGRAVFRTKEGMVGIAPDYVARGDQVWDLVGGEVPFVLRSAKSGEDGERTGRRKKYSLVGECYVHRIMNGELWRTAGPGSRTTVRGEDLVFEDIELV